MPKIYRSMKEDADGKPVIESTNKGLGARISIDVDIDQDGKVILNGKGMSVAPTWRDLPPFRLSKRLRDKLPDARGAPDIRCFTMGNGPFQDGALTGDLDLKQDDPKHGVVVPRTPIPIAEYQSNLASTRDLWMVDEA